MITKNKNTPKAKLLSTKDITGTQKVSNRTNRAIISVNKLNQNTQNQKTGKLGEYMAGVFLLTRYFNIIERNARTRRGEIDIICEKDGIIHFVEVKSVQVDTSNLEFLGDSTNKYNPVFSAYDPVFRVSSKKISRIKKAAAYYMQKRQYTNKEIRFDIVVAYLFGKERKCTIRYHSNIFL